MQHVQVEKNKAKMKNVTGIFFTKQIEKIN